MSGEGEENACYLMNSEVSLILERRHLQQISDDGLNTMPQVFQKSLEYVKRFSRYNNPDAVRQVREILSSHELSEFELAVLRNLCPETVEEAIAVVPSLKDNVKGLDDESIDKLLNDLSRVKKFE